MPPKRETYTRQRDATVSALGCGRKLFDVVVNELATRCLHNPSAVGGGVIRVALAECDTLGHCGCYRDIEHSQHGALALTQPFQRIPIPLARSAIASNRAPYHHAQLHTIPHHPSCHLACTTSKHNFHSLCNGRGKIYLRAAFQHLIYRLPAHNRVHSP